ncbi:hypothetical protein KC340_g12002 [Hortaea werneckii]|nr:hypothetical protein KC342_g12394 [Hortaea werneckii]KAI7077891.1 hypothetical protein KC339_g13666 [Hortaea werneckii]KAI7210055.1 hypothetical protein KC365_g15445 [Hortaea werneckii]KAI7305353.1 hypothetical protein KC340_g12002 [Hortaea werneckii]KAI7391856.1 hypothetical protein KC328_g7293 [Hortaea werneckii]
MSDGQHASNEALQKLLDTGEYSDLTIECGDRTFQVHKNIICTRSEYFAAACATGTIELQSSADPNAAKDDPSLDDPDAVKLMIDFLYLHDYVAIETCFSETLNASNKRPFGATNGDAGAIMHAKVYALGCKYQIPSLQKTSLGKFEAAAVLAWGSEEFVHAVHLVCSTTPDSDKGLRDAAARVILEHDDELCNKPAMEAVIRSSSAAIATTETRKVAIIAKPVFNTKKDVRENSVSLIDLAQEAEERGDGGRGLLRMAQLCHQERETVQWPKKLQM